MTEQQSLWPRLQEAKKPILLYGMGDGADKILAVLSRYHIPCAGIFASDEFVRGQSFRGYPVLTYAQARARFGEFIILLAFGTALPQVLMRIYMLAVEQELYAPDVPVYGDVLFNDNFLYNNKDELQLVYNMLADEPSRKVYAGMLNYKYSGKISYLKEIETRPQELISLFPPRSEEIYLDLGAYNGDTVRDFIRYAPDYRRIIAVEPDARNYRKLAAWVNEASVSGVELRNLAVWKERTMLHAAKRTGRGSSLSTEGAEIPADSIDNILAGTPVTSIKMDVEGAEQMALLGGAETLRRYSPRLNVALYHRTEDIITLPLLVRELQPAYRLYLRHHPCLPAWDTNLYAML